MHVTIMNKITGTVQKVNFKKNDTSKIRDIGLSAHVEYKKYIICLIADSEDDIDFIINNFHNIPIPASPAKRAVWVGDMALFILVNYPDKSNAYF